MNNLQNHWFHCICQHWVTISKVCY